MKSLDRYVGVSSAECAKIVDGVVRYSSFLSHQGIEIALLDMMRLSSLLIEDIATKLRGVGWRIHCRECLSQMARQG